ncbi:hypothetical protein IKE98_02385 [Candidatus Saccharibacteria bacterium]|nr:hypothetical protein [Candidatus Saccharibacteria bacterium]
MKQKTISASNKTKSPSSKNHKNGSLSKKISIIIIVSAMLLVVVALIIPLIFSEENLTKQKLDSMAEDYYKNHLYSDFINSGKFDSENLEETMQIYAERGFSHVFLRQILLHEAYRDTEDAKFLREACDENKTIIQFFPDAPYTKESFHTKITYSCNF